MTRLLIARHGNTFDAHETPRRVGGRTNLPLSSSGREQAQALGRYLRQRGLLPDMVFTSRLQRTMETAYLALQEAGKRLSPVPLASFDEIDYGPDENRTEAEVVARIGLKAISDWDESAILPDGWQADTAAIIENWKKFAANVAEQYEGDTVLVVTSNGIARFAPHITGDMAGFRTRHKLKISTGALCVLTFEAGAWRVAEWNVRPPLQAAPATGSATGSGTGGGTGGGTGNDGGSIGGNGGGAGAPPVAG